MTPALTLLRRRVPVVGPVRIYVCGITPYDTTHLGHAATFVWVDALSRVLRRTGVPVQVCRNITDVDDVLSAAAAAGGRDPERMAGDARLEFDRDMKALRVRQPTSEPVVHRHVDDVLALAAALLGANAAYEREGTVWFRGAGACGRRPREEALRLLAAAGDAPGTLDDSREDPTDVPVWRASRGGEPAWPSPWGAGRPGWHASCTAMALSTYGPNVDVQAGGADLLFPHHAYQAAQAEAATGVRPFARTGMHAGVVTYGGSKMAKSTGNLVFVRDLLAEAEPAAVRLMILDRPYASGWDYTPDLLRAAGERLEGLRSAAGRADASPDGAAAVLEALTNDLDIAGAVERALDLGGPAAGLVLEIVDPEA